MGLSRDILGEKFSDEDNITIKLSTVLTYFKDTYGKNDCSSIRLLVNRYNETYVALVNRVMYVGRFENKNYSLGILKFRGMYPYNASEPTALYLTEFSNNPNPLCSLDNDELVVVSPYYSIRYIPITYMYNKTNYIVFNVSGIEKPLILYCNNGINEYVPLDNQSFDRERGIVYAGVNMRKLNVRDELFLVTVQNTTEEIEKFTSISMLSSTTIAEAKTTTHTIENSSTETETTESSLITTGTGETEVSSISRTTSTIIEIPTAIQEEGKTSTTSTTTPAYIQASRQETIHTDAHDLGSNSTIYYLIIISIVAVAIVGFLLYKKHRSINYQTDKC